MKKTAFLFPGQGAQYIGMSKKLCEQFPIAKTTFEEANNILGFNLENLCFNGKMSELTKTENAQPAILTASVAAYRVFKSEIGAKAEYSAGHSLGEISALCCAGAIEFKDALLLVRKRGELMQQAVPLGEGAMAAIGGVAREIIEKECENVSTAQNEVVCANFNSPDQTVISGKKQAVEEVSKNITEKGGFAIPLKVSGPFHSPLMKPAAEKFAEELKKIKFNEPENKVISNYTVLPYSGNFIENLTKQIISPVRWIETMEYLNKNGITLAIEMGPKQILKGLMIKTVPTLKTLSFDPETDLSAVKYEFSKGDSNITDDVNGKELIKMCICNAVCTKNSNWNNDEYQKGVVESYKKLTSMRDSFEKSGANPDISQLREAISLLKLLLETKKVPKEEQTEIFCEICEKTGAFKIFPEYRKS